MSESRSGHVTKGPNGPTIEFERLLHAPISGVWDKLTTSDGLERWLAPASVDLRPNGSIHIDFGHEGGRTGGEIVDLVPGRTIEFHWALDGEPDSVVRFELDPLDETTTRLRLLHRLLPPAQAVGYGAGWHAHLDQLEQSVGEGDRIDWARRFAEVLPTYERQVV